MTDGRRLRALIWVAHHLESADVVRDYVDGVTEAFSGHDVETAWGVDAFRGRMQGVEALVCWGWHPSVLEEADALEWIQFGSAGLNHALTPELLASGIRLSTLKGVHPLPVAEHVVAMMLAHARRLPRMALNQSRRVWERQSILPAVRMVQGSWVGVVGMGRIGREVARKCRAMGARVTATRSRQASEAEADEWVEKDDLAPLLSKADWIVLTLPQTPVTAHLISANELAQMKPEAVLINVGRGACVDEAALVEALQAGRIAGACMDVFEHEPLPDDSPLWEMENVIITPHVAATTTDYGRDGAEIVRANLAAFLRGEQMPTEYDRERGY